MKKILFCPDFIAEVPSTLLIPDVLHSFFLKKKDQFSCRVYLRNLLAKYGQKVNKKTWSYKTEYQCEGQELKRENFRPWDEDWLKMKLIAGANGISMTMLFVIMMVWDMIDEENTERGIDKAWGAPTGIIIGRYIYNPKTFIYTKYLYFKT